MGGYINEESTYSFLRALYIIYFIFLCIKWLCDILPRYKNTSDIKSVMDPILNRIDDSQRQAVVVDRVITKVSRISCPVLTA